MFYAKCRGNRLSDHFLSSKTANRPLTWKNLLQLSEIITSFILNLGDAKESIKRASQTLSGGYPSSPTPMSPGPGSRHQLRRESAINLEDGLNDETGGRFTFSLLEIQSQKIIFLVIRTAASVFQSIYLKGLFLAVIKNLKSD